MATAVQATPTPAHELIYRPGELPKLRSNYGRHLDQDTVGWMRETPIDTPLPEMRRRFEEEGYIFVKNLLPRSDVLDMRRAYFEHLSPTGILAPGTDPVEGIFNPLADPVAHHGNGGRDLPEDEEKVQKLISAHTHPAYLNFLSHPTLHTFVRDFMAWKSDILIKRTLLRHNVPQGFSTGIHYDKIFLRAGEADFLTAWVPIGDCKAEGGGLMYLENSTDVGKAMEEDFNSRAKELSPEERINGFNVNMARDGQLSHDAVELTSAIQEGVHGGERMKRRWLVGDYEAGDVVFHNPYMIHGAVKNEDPNGRIRLSTDLRFYEEGSELDERWMRDVWRPGDGL
ncbi:hypothetical protein M409DRAFT_19097 [Zasmidium cellare ATCC 36951]|uniref:Uncharacterized protein n=1 Tax=Zasmidium cellare ATCC 36951 TaxID=1080233 RepID=A0A6A6D0F7_ZASCE|nr:uncharacterized protein M409DRAFT_19097 [Zasmidium cellare ATCC 36951]KAF2171126.1 hypothetical protein M409DRAFT_19097 [Zasmidium cellare ATCC 36951]